MVNGHLEDSLRREIESYLENRLSAVKQEITTLQSLLNESLSTFLERQTDVQMEGSLVASITEHLHAAHERGIELAASESSRAKASSDMAIVKAAISGDQRTEIAVRYSQSPRKSCFFVCAAGRFLRYQRRPGNRMAWSWFRRNRGRRRYSTDFTCRWIPTRLSAAPRRLWPRGVVVQAHMRKIIRYLIGSAKSRRSESSRFHSWSVDELLPFFMPTPPDLIQSRSTSKRSRRWLPFPEWPLKCCLFHARLRLRRELLKKLRRLSEQPQSSSTSPRANTLSRRRVRLNPRTPERIRLKVINPNRYRVAT